MASCTQIDTLLQPYLDGELSDAERVILEEHVSDCVRCRHQLKRQKRSTAFLFETYAEQRLQHDLTPVIMAHLPEMDRGREYVREVNWRVKHPASRFNPFLTLMPVLAPVVILASAVALFYSWPATRSAGPNAVGVIASGQGAVVRDGADGQRVRAYVKSYVNRGDHFETGQDSNMMLLLAGPTVIKLSENTSVSVLDDRDITVEQGRIWFDVARDERLFSVNTPSGLITVFGTTFEVHVAPDCTTVTLAQGSVTVENDAALLQMQPDQLVELRPGLKPLVARPIDSEAALAWSKTITPNVDAQELYDSTIRLASSTHMQAEQVFAVVTSRDNERRTVESITFEWKPSADTVGHCGYHVFVRDEHMRTLVRRYIEGRVFDNTGRRSYQITIPDEPIRGVNVLLIKVVPDYTSGRVETSFSKVYAWGIQEQ